MYGSRIPLTHCNTLIKNKISIECKWFCSKSHDKYINGKYRETCLTLNIRWQKIGKQKIDEYKENNFRFMLCQEYRKLSLLCFYILNCTELILLYLWSILFSKENIQTANFNSI